MPLADDEGAELEHRPEGEDDAESATADRRRRQPADPERDFGEPKGERRPEFGAERKVMADGEHVGDFARRRGE